MIIDPEFNPRIKLIEYYPQENKTLCIYRTDTFERRIHEYIGTPTWALGRYSLPRYRWPGKHPYWDYYINNNVNSRF